MQNPSAPGTGDGEPSGPPGVEPQQRGNPALRPGNSRSHALIQGDASATFECFVATVQRLEQILDRETEMLDGREIGAPRDFNREKRLALVELTRCLGTLRDRECEAAGFDAKPALARLRHRLEANLTALETHMKAVGEVAACIASAIVEHESDGTYSVVSNGRGIGE